MAEKKVTCRYCDSEEVSDLAVPGGSFPICDRHRQELSERAIHDLDRIMGHPVNNSAVKSTDKPAPPEKGF